jgi:hypothetical protein
MDKHQFIIIFLSLVLKLAAIAGPGDTLHVITHHAATVVTDPSKGYKAYKGWGVFPAGNIPLRKMVMFVKFASPDSFRTADWDYMDRISISRRGGVNGTVPDYEIGRMLTPYGGAFGKKWQFTWQVDVTDFSLLLRDSVEINYNHTGYEPNNDRGWAITIDFEIVKGQPVNEPLSIEKIYDDSYSYGDSTRPIEEKLHPVSFNANSKAAFARLRMVQTGHGSDNPDHCGEFCNKYRELWFDGKMVDKKSIWKKCGDNPLYPQAGTWLSERANWCPGNLMQPDLYDLPVNGGQHVIDVNMQNYIATKPSANEVISAYLIQYKKAAGANDIAIEDIITPSVKSIYKRQNPSSFNPEMIIKNAGNNDIHSISFRYGTVGFSRKTYNWKGALPVGKVTSILLPAVIDDNPGENNFQVELLKPNGHNDSYAQDNSLVVPFIATPVHDSILVFYLKTNNQPEQNGYVLQNSNGTVIRERKVGSLQARTEYRDTLHLAPGAYQLYFVDTAGNGLEVWFNSRGGQGLTRLMNNRGQMLKNFESDFGSFWIYNFKVASKPDAISDQYAINLYPTRTNDKTTLDYFANKPGKVTVQLITDPGAAIVEEHIYNDLKEGTFIYDLGHYPKGRFYLKVFADGKEQFTKRIRYRE